MVRRRQIGRAPQQIMIVRAKLELLLINRVGHIARLPCNIDDVSNAYVAYAHHASGSQKGIPFNTTALLVGRMTHVLPKIFGVLSRLLPSGYAFDT